MSPRKATGSFELEPRIFIPTYGRVNKQTTLAELRHAGFKGDSVTLVVGKSDGDLDAYRASAREWDVRLLVTKAHGICETRQAIMDHVKHGKLLMMDDDLVIRKRTKDGKSFKRCTPAQLRQMVKRLWGWLDESAHLGLNSEFMAQAAPRGEGRFRGYHDVLGYNLSLFPKPRPKFRCEVLEDADMNLQLATAGLLPRICTEFTKQTVRYVKGGCSTWRTANVEERAIRHFVELWPEYATIKENPNTISKLRVQVAWARVKKVADAAQAGRR